MKDKKIGTPEEIIAYGLDSLTVNKNVSLSIKDFIYIYKSIEELRRFFHNENHYKTIDDIHRYIGTTKEGMIKVLNDIYLKKMDVYISEDIEKLLESEELDCPYLPFYYNYKG